MNNILPKIYPIYTLEILIYTPLFLIIGGYLAFSLDKLFPVFNKDKKKIIIFIEIILQSSITGFLSFYFRDLVRFYRKMNPNLKGKPEKYATIITGSIMFYLQVNMRKKIVFLLHGTEKLN